MKPNSSERLVVVHNTKSSHAANVEHGVFDKLDARNLSSIRFLTPSSHPEENIDAIANLVQPGDTILSAAGDGTANAVLNGVLTANHEGVRVGFLGYGNFNDMAHTFNARAALRDPLALLDSDTTVELNPLVLTKNGEHWRYAGLYATLGWTAVAAAEFDDPRVRESLQHGGANIVSSLARLGLHYFKTRHTSDIAPFYRDGGPVQTSTTDVLAVNGPIMAKIIRSGKDKYEDADFLLRDLDVSGLVKNSGFLVASALGRMPGALSTSDELHFTTPSTLPVQIDGEFSHLEGVNDFGVSKPAGGRTVQVIKGR